MWDAGSALRRGPRLKRTRYEGERAEIQRQLAVAGTLGLS